MLWGVGCVSVFLMSVYAVGSGVCCGMLPVLWCLGSVGSVVWGVLCCWVCCAVSAVGCAVGCVFSVSAVGVNVTVCAVVCGLLWGVGCADQVARGSCHALAGVADTRTFFPEPGQQQATSQFSQRKH